MPQRSRAPLAAKPAPPPPEPEQDSEEELIPPSQSDLQPQDNQQEYDFYDTSASSDIDDGPAVMMPMQPSNGTSSEEDSVFYDEQGIEEVHDYVEGYEEPSDEDAPMGGRLGRFQVMTPITERTYEFTSNSLRAQSTPSERFGRPVFSREDPVQVAEQLAAELRREEEEGEGFDEDEPMHHAEEQTGTLNFSDAISVASKFKTSNPCNPFDPPIIATLLSLVPADSAFVDLQPQRAEMLDSLQKFARKKVRRASGNTSSSSAKSASDSDFVEVRLGHGKERAYKVTDKLGEGGFGAVFEAIDVHALNQKRQEHGLDSDDDDVFDDDDGEGSGIPRVALKVVTPRISGNSMSYVEYIRLYQHNFVTVSFIPRAYTHIATSRTLY
ncbi:hypothetical protein QCA50_006030 [Cerrena zonata]|uniref:Protein kinase domain-containing protein n=1 Tax=Cerrena zonata TaxID=2478898 RepID=A0AAW0GLY1_9APHY